MASQNPLIKVVVLDIEGTTTSISFVTDVMFPYIRRELQSYLEKTWDSEQTIADVDDLRKLAQSDIDSGNASIVPIPPQTSDKSEVLNAVVKNVFAQMDLDRKTTALKQLQGHIWKHAFESGELQGDIYPDVMVAFDSWKQSNTFIFIYSSGSISAQKLLFGFNKHGNLLPYIVDHFDTTIGSKIEEQSYLNIFEAIKKSPVGTSIPDLTKDQILFGTDNIKEAIAADIAGYSTILSVRPGTAPLPAEHKFHAVTTFADFWKYYRFE